jgi:uncharacterized iron-regulated membrane protein
LFRRHVWFACHSWLGLTSGLLMFVVCWSGTVAVFSYELDWLLNPELRSIEASSPVAWGSIHDAVKHAHPDWSISQINAPYSQGYAAEVWVDRPDGVTQRIYAEPRTGRLVGETSYFNVQRFFRSLHMSLFVGEWPVFRIPLGYLVVGLLSIPLLLSLLTSLLFYRRWWQRFLQLEWRHGPRVLWSDLHKLAGLWSLWFAALIGVTGLWYLLEWKLPESPSAPLSQVAASASFLDVDELIDRAEREYPKLDVRVVSLWQMADGVFEVQGQDGSWLVRDRAAKVWVNPVSGEALGAQRVAELSLYQRWIDTADPLHFGNFGGLWSKVLWFSFGVFLSGLCLTGAYLQAQRQRRRHTSTQMRLPIVAAYAVTVSVLLISAAFAVKELRGYGSDDHWPEVPLAVIAFVTAWTATAMAALTAWIRAVR